MLSRHQQAKEYLKKANETHQAIEVRSAVWSVRDELLSLPYRRRSDLLRACISRVFLL